MRWVIPNNVTEISGIVGRLLLTILVVFGFLCVLALLVRIHASFLASQSQLRDAAIYVASPLHPAALDSAIQPFWPEFPRSKAGNIQGVVIDGVQIVTEEWEGVASASDVLLYYREQMAARGWRDVTEETYSLQPESLDAANGLQDERFVNDYRNVMDSTLVLSRGEWSMHITAEPGKEDGQKTAVKIYAAATPSIEEFLRGLESSLFGKGAPSGSPLVAEQQNGKEHYHTTVAAKREAPERAFQESLEHLGSEGWRPVMFLPRQQARSGYFAWLVKDKAYAALSVSAASRGQGSSVTLTEVTPESKSY